MTLHQAGERAQHTTSELFQPPNVDYNLSCSENFGSVMKPRSGDSLCFCQICGCYGHVGCELAQAEVEAARMLATLESKDVLGTFVPS